MTSNLEEEEQNVRLIDGWVVEEVGLGPDGGG